LIFNNVCLCCMMSKLVFQFRKNEYRKIYNIQNLFLKYKEKIHFLKAETNALFIPYKLRVILLFSNLSIFLKQNYLLKMIFMKSYFK
jgi:hypothetical protein